MLYLSLSVLAFSETHPQPYVHLLSIAQLGEESSETLSTDTKVKPYRCEHCGRSFSRQDSLARHIKLHSQSSTSSTLRHDSRSPLKHTTPVTRDEVTRASGSGESHTRLVDERHHSSVPDTPLSITPENLPFGIPDITMSGPSRQATRVAGQHDTLPSPGPFDLPAPPELDIWQLLSGDVLPGAESIQASPNFFTSLGLDMGSISDHHLLPNDMFHNSQQNFFPSAHQEEHEVLPHSLQGEETRPFGEESAFRSVDGGPERSQEILSEARTLLSDQASLGSSPYHAETSDNVR